MENRRFLENDFGEHHGGPVLKKVTHDLMRQHETHLIGRVIRDADIWEMSPGSLILGFLSINCVELLIGQLEEERISGIIIDSFIDAVNEVNEEKLEEATDWEFKIGLIKTEEPVGLDTAEISVILESGLTRRSISHSPLDPNIVFEIENILETVENKHLQSPSILPNLPSCKSCNEKIDPRDGVISFLGNSKEEASCYDQIVPKYERTCFVAAYHQLCIPKEAHHTIFLEKLSTPSEVLYWTFRYNSYPWFIESNWSNLMVSLFNINIPGTLDN